MRLLAAYLRDLRRMDKRVLRRWAAGRRRDPGLVVEVHRVRCRRCGVRTERLPFVAGKARYTTRLETAVARDCEAAPVSRVAPRWGLPASVIWRAANRSGSVGKRRSSTSSGRSAYTNS